MLGLDPDPSALWPVAHGDDAEAGEPAGEGVAARAGRAVLGHCRAVIDAVAPACVAVKPQLARFELLGAAGWAALEAVVEHAQARGLLVIADGKRGDIDVTARGLRERAVRRRRYAVRDACRARRGSRDGQPADGRRRARAVRDGGARGGRGRARARAHVEPGREPTSRTCRCRTAAPSGSAWRSSSSALGADGIGESGLSDVGAVIGATEPQHLARARELMPHAPFLLPGVGAQGGRVEELAPAFAPGRAGGLISASRSIVDAHRTRRRRAGAGRARGGASGCVRRRGRCLPKRPRTSASLVWRSAAKACRRGKADEELG